MPNALINGITAGWSYLADFFGRQGYEVHGLKRRSSSFNTDRVDHLYVGLAPDRRQILPALRGLDRRQLAGLLSDGHPAGRDLQLGRADHVKVSFDIPEYTMDVVGVGAVRLLEAVRRTACIAASIKLRRARCTEHAAAARRDVAFPSAQPLRPAPSSGPPATVNYRESYGQHASLRNPLQP